jgi:hypothetical protein
MLQQSRHRFTDSRWFPETGIATKSPGRQSRNGRGLRLTSSGQPLQ